MLVWTAMLLAFLAPSRRLLSVAQDSPYRHNEDFYRNFQVVYSFDTSGSFGLFGRDRSDGRQAGNVFVRGVDPNAGGTFPGKVSSSQGSLNLAGRDGIIGDGRLGPSPAGGFGQSGARVEGPAVILGDGRFGQGLGHLQGNLADRFGPILVGGVEGSGQGGFRAAGSGGGAAIQGSLGGSGITHGGPIGGFVPAAVRRGPVVAGGRGRAAAAAVLGGGQVRVVEAPLTPVVTHTHTIDRYVTRTDAAFHSVPVTLTDLVVRTVTATTRQVLQTPTDELVSLQTTVLVRPTSVTVTCTKTDYRLLTETSVDRVTVTHTSYRIKQATYTTTATQPVSHTSTFVRTIVRTERTTYTDYRTITQVVYAHNTYY